MNQHFKVNNILTVDLENWFCNPSIHHNDWDTLPDRAQICTDSILKILSDCNAKATFFVNGWLAERHSALIRSISDQGHEIASHGMLHRQIYTQTPQSFRTDISCCRKLLEDITGKAIEGYRAPMFTITPVNSWAWEILSEEGYKWSSSIFPTSNPLYGWPDFPEGLVRINSSLIEVPMTSLPPGIAAGGGFWLRALPLIISRIAIQRRNRLGLPGIVYIHPWETDPSPPAGAMPLKWTLAHYWNLKVMSIRFKTLLKEFDFSPAGSVIKDFQKTDSNTAEKIIKDFTVPESRNNDA